MKQEDLIDKYVEAHANCRWMDAGELRDLLNSFVGELLEEAVEGEIVDSGFDDGTAILKAIVPDRRYDSGDKVRIIVLPKEDEK